VYRVQLKTEGDVSNMLQFLQETQDLLDYWQTELHPGGHVDVRVPSSAASLLSSPLLHNLQLAVKIPDVEQLLTRVENESKKRYSTIMLYLTSLLYLTTPRAGGAYTACCTTPRAGDAYTACYTLSSAGRSEPSQQEIKCTTTVLTTVQQRLTERCID